MRLHVDTSRAGMHGIGRYSREVVNRLQLPWQDLGHRLRRPLPVDAVNPRRLTLPAGDLVYAPGFNAGVTRARQLLTLHDLIHLQVPSESSSLKRVYYDRIVRPAVRGAGVVFTVSDTSRDVIAEWLQDDDVEIVNTGNGVSAAFRPDGPHRQDTTDYFVYVGNFREHKNTAVMLEAVRRSPKARLVIVTSDSELAERQVAERAIAGQVTILTGVDDSELAGIYRGALGLVMPSTLEGFGLPAAEALACGVPVAFWQGCASVGEIVAARGIAVQEADSIEEWVDALNRLEAAERGFEWDKRSAYSWQAVAEVVEDRLRAEVDGSGGNASQ